MAVYAPIKLVGGNLGQRHRYYNSLVSDAHANGTSFQDVESLPETSPLDRLFKIDLAAKFQNVEYIVRNLKDNDMLYVSRALRAKWLLSPEYRNIMNPTHLEDELFPQMITTAVTRMKHWLYINLHDPHRCAEFYEHFKDKAFDFAIKFLCNCHVDYILDEYPKTLTKITPHYLKIFCEKSPKLAKVYFDAVATNTKVAERCRFELQKYYNSIKCMLKTDPDVFLDITESIHEKRDLGPGATEYIVKHCKRRFMAKAELYTASLLHIPTIAKHLSVDECEELVLRLARAQYLNWWFSYKNVEPLLKRLGPERRTQFKKRVFVDKDVGELVDAWPYPTPKQPIVEDTHIFDDIEELSYKLEYMCYSAPKCRAQLGMQLMRCCRVPIIKSKSELDRLFDEFRFVGFDRAYHMLSRRFAATSSQESRRNMLLVLASKTGGRKESIQTLLDLMARHTNEPANLRAAVLRSLVKRASVWRLSNDAWSSLLEFGHGLGLDGGPAEADCREGLHAVILRHLLSETVCESMLCDAFLKDFSTLSEYTLASDERPRVVEGLSRLLINAAEEAQPQIAAGYLTKLLNVYKDHRICVNSTFDLVQAAKALSDRDPAAAREILVPLYNAHVARKELFLPNLEFCRDEASCMNILRHNPNVLAPKNVLEQIYNDGKYRCSKRYDQFMYKLVLYFSEDLSNRFLEALDDKVTEKPHVNLARSVAIQMGPDIRSYLKKFDETKDVDGKRMSAALRACLHLCRPQPDIDTFEMKYLGVKAVATRVAICRKVDTDKFVEKLLTWPRTFRIAIALAHRSRNEAYAVVRAAKLNTFAAIKIALEYILRYGNNVDPKVWEIIRPLLLVQNKFKPSGRCLRHVWSASVPSAITADFWPILFSILINLEKKMSFYNLPNKMYQLLSELNSDEFENVLITLITREEYTYIVIYVRVLLLCESEEQQIKRFEKIGRPFLEWLEKSHKNKSDQFNIFLTKTLKALNYAAVFFNTKYVSCLPIFEKIVEWMHKVVPIEENFDKYVDIHLTMLYFKAIRQSITSCSEVFHDTDRTRKEGVDIVGQAFGKNIAEDLHDLINKYFDSIVELYKQSVNNYIDVYFHHGSSKLRFIEVLIKAILKESDGGESRLGYYIFKTQRYGLPAEVQKDIKVILSGKTDQTLFFVYAE